jgi:hypothetical protein
MGYGAFLTGIRLMPDSDLTIAGVYIGVAPSWHLSRLLPQPISPR